MKSCPRAEKRYKSLGWLAVIALGLLIWTRLRLVSSLPRTVYADPADRGVIGPENGAPVHADGSRTESPDLIAPR